MPKTYRLAAAPIDHDDPTFYYDVDPDLLLPGEAAGLVGVSNCRFCEYVERGLIAPHCVVGEVGHIRLYHRYTVLALRDRRNREKSPQNVWHPGRPYHGPPYKIPTGRPPGRPRRASQGFTPPEAEPVQPSSLTGAKG